MIKRFVLCVVCLIGFGCSQSVGEKGGEKTLEVGMKVRWFPVDSAEGYTVRVEEVGGEDVFEETILPNGCNHRALDGYTAGLCEYSLDLFTGEDVAALKSETALKKEYRVEVRSFNQDGQSNASEITALVPF